MSSFLLRYLDFQSERENQNNNKVQLLLNNNNNNRYGRKLSTLFFSHRLYFNLLLGSSHSRSHSRVPNTRHTVGQLTRWIRLVTARGIVHQTANEVETDWNFPDGNTRAKGTMCVWGGSLCVLNGQAHTSPPAQDVMRLAGQTSGQRSTLVIVQRSNWQRQRVLFLLCDANLTQSQ